MKIALVAPHIFMQDALSEDVIFSPGDLAVDLCNKLQDLGVDVDLWTPGPVEKGLTNPGSNKVGDMSGFSKELSLRGYGAIELLRKHPLTFASLARQVQADMIAQVYEMAGDGIYDLVHVYVNEEDIGIQFARLCHAPVVFTHHDPLNLTSGYRSLFENKKHLKLIAISQAQKHSGPRDLDWVDTVHHGLPKDRFRQGSGGDYLLFIGRIISAKGVHLAIKAVNQFNEKTDQNIKLKIAGRHYDDGYFDEFIQPLLGPNIEILGHVKTINEKQELIGGAMATIVPSTFEEPFGMVNIESLSCGTPIIGLDSGAIGEIIKDGHSGFLIQKRTDQQIIDDITTSIGKIRQIKRSNCRQDFEENYTSTKMATRYKSAYERLIRE